MKLKLVNKKFEAKDTYTFTFEPSEKLTWQAGQYIYISLPKLNYPDDRGDTRHFTISNSPTEGNNILLTTRIREQSGYKKTLNELEIGSMVESKGPNGLFVFPINHKPLTINHLFIAGGIGITPFRSIIKYNIDKNLHDPMYLIYSNSDSEFVFKEDLDKWSSENNFLKIEYQVTTVLGRIDKLKIEELIKNWKLEIKNCTPWVVGPPLFVNSIENILENELSVDEDNIKIEKFTGY